MRLGLAYHYIKTKKKIKIQQSQFINTQHKKHMIVNK